MSEEDLKDKIHEQYMEIQELNKARKFDIEYNKHLQKEIIRLNNIINELEKELDLNLPFKVVGVRHLKNKLQELKGEDKE